jgi:hypothetical protein
MTDGFDATAVTYIDDGTGIEPEDIESDGQITEPFGSVPQLL